MENWEADYINHKRKRRDLRWEKNILESAFWVLKADTSKQQLVTQTGSAVDPVGFHTVS